MYRVLLFDLDGTLTASGEGITKSVQYALHKMGREAEDLKALEVFVGPPLLSSLCDTAACQRRRRCRLSVSTGNGTM